MRQRGLPLILLLAVSLSCGLPGATPSSPGSAVPSPDAGPAEPTVAPPEALDPHTLDEPPPPPSGFVDSIQEGVAAGTWTYEEGLLTALRVLAGEVAAEEAFGASTPANAEATGVLLDARAYLEAAPDSPAQAEINRLYHLIVPDVDRLLPYSRPESTASYRPPGLAATESDSEACADLYAEGFPSGSSLTCYVFKTTPIGNNLSRVFYPESWGPSDPRLAYAHASGQAIVDAYKVFAAYGKMEHVDLVFTLLKYSGKETLAALVDSLGGQSVCKIVVFPLALTGTEPQFKQVIAHEMFHCYQQWNYPVHFPVSDTDGSWSVHDWWGESTADYFSNVVYPSVNLEWNTLGAFSAKSALLSLLYMSYENSVFFQFLANKTSPTEVLALIKTLPVSGNEAAHAAALAQFPNIAALFHQFARDYVERLIFDTNYPSLVPTGLLQVPKKQQFPVGGSDHTISLMPSNPFTLTRYILAFQPDKVYANSTTEVGSGTYGTKMLAGEAFAAGWSPVPETIAASCGSTTLYALVTTTDVAGSYSANVTSDKTTETLCDPCLFGTWNIDHQSFADYLAAPFLETQGLFELQSNAGEWRYTFKKSGVIDALFNYAVAYRLHQGGETLPIDADVIMNIGGSGSGIYWIPEPAHLAMMAVSSNYKVEQMMWINGQEVEGGPQNAFDPLKGGGGFPEYTCSGNTLTLDFAPTIALLPPVTYIRAP